ncbi:hypothetical protein RADP37_04648 [Roseomonas mucosa]|uniref:Uncharacterized protein n=1 Tax=Roseomonas mucosa TaxID=207340 RepID=A0A4Y1N3D4_9PROT|nr:hypothetical protein RADP37_04648 [Roseomonas mucosa]
MRPPAGGFLSHGRDAGCTRKSNPVVADRAVGSFRRLNAGGIRWDTG